MVVSTRLYGPSDASNFAAQNSEPYDAELDTEASAWMNAELAKCFGIKLTANQTLEHVLMQIREQLSVPHPSYLLVFLHVDEFQHDLLLCTHFCQC